MCELICYMHIFQNSVCEEILQSLMALAISILVGSSQ